MSLINVNQAAALLKAEQVVALPTETVYGLAGRIDSEVALSRIFKTKARPFYDPLIVHVSDLKQATHYGQWDSISERLAQEFWPGPLTLVVNKKKNVSDLITNGGPTVAFRQPDHPLFLQTLTALGTPLAAPSANMFGKTSPTTATHVIEEFDNTVPVVDGGSCKNGIESTVVQVINNEVRILRPGVIDQSRLQKVLRIFDNSIQVRHSDQANSPGNLKNHYQPVAPLYLVSDNTISEEQLQSLLSKAWPHPVAQWTLPKDPEQAARKLYADLRYFSRQQQACYLTLEKHMNNEHWQGINDRLDKACSGYILRKNKHWSLQQK